MAALNQRRIILGVSGGIAAYKSPDLVRRLRDTGADVRVVMTRGAMEFVRPLTFQAVSGNPVHTSLLDADAEAAMGHIELARWAEAVLIAPASADLIARLANGHADDLLSTLCLATDAPLAVAPAMNRLMWAHPATRANTALLMERGVQVFGPGEGDQACGETGSGRMLEPLQLVGELAGLFAEPLLSGQRVVITAGPTREAIDPVRYISNRSSGKMGFALAASAAAMGAEVILIAGPCNLPTPRGVRRIDVETAVAMHEAVMEALPGCGIFIGCAAVADYRVAEPSGRKIKKSERTLSLDLIRNPDILADVAARDNPPFTVGFAAETNDLQAHAEDKRRRKGLNMIAANLVGEPGSGFESDDNALWVRWADGEQALDPAPKRQLADALMRLVAERYRGQR
ncbi:MAG: bifunctional phosphopantothenoylcysteine decarboxylase/phosphopantothenate--cysteine ligase CoaBC [Aquisalimonadaceae bacterium]